MPERSGWSDSEFAYEIRSAVRDAVDSLDPIGLVGIDNPDEYEPEVDRIVLKLVPLHEAPTVEEVLDLVYRVFVAMFDEQIAGERERYRPAAEQIAMVWS